MAIWSRYAATRDPKMDMNLSDIVEMDVESGHDTTNTLGTKHGTHPLMKPVQIFAKHNER